MKLLVLGFTIGLFWALSASASSDLAHDIAITKAHRTLYAVRVLNSATTGTISVAPGDACEIYSAGALGLLSQEGGRALVEYHPALVFLHQGKLINLWAATKAGLGHFCPAGTLFEISVAELEKLERARLLDIQELVVHSEGEGLSWESRRLRLAREGNKIALGAERWAALEQENTTVVVRLPEVVR